jgi:hypothetical protein
MGCKRGELFFRKLADFRVIRAPTDYLRFEEQERRSPTDYTDSTDRSARADKGWFCAFDQDSVK